MRVDASGHDHREVAVGHRHLFDRRQQPLERVLLEVDLVGAKAEVAAGQTVLRARRRRGGCCCRSQRRQMMSSARADETIGMSAVSRCRLYRRQRQRQAGARDDRVGAGVEGRAHRGHEVTLQRDHDVDAGEAAASLGGLDLEPHGLVDADLAPDAPRDHPVKARAGDQPQTARDGHGRCQRREGHADAHAALEDGRASCMPLRARSGSEEGRLTRLKSYDIAGGMASRLASGVATNRCAATGGRAALRQPPRTGATPWHGDDVVQRAVQRGVVGREDGAAERRSADAPDAEAGDLLAGSAGARLQIRADHARLHVEGETQRRWSIRQRLP